MLCTFKSRNGKKTFGKTIPNHSFDWLIMLVFISECKNKNDQTQLFNHQGICILYSIYITTKDLLGPFLIIYLFLISVCIMHYNSIFHLLSIQLPKPFTEERYTVFFIIIQYSRVNIKCNNLKNSVICWEPVSIFYYTRTGSKIKWP